jgi:2-polyprenyl-3-methyl-5-hydroxy-6-metoxy-1,4-benzoquinol methylase
MSPIVESNPKKFWNRRSKTFPRYSPGEDQFEAGLLRLIGEQGIAFEGRSVLDVGCGCGMYTIRLAQAAARVTALDISDEMLSILKRDAEAEGLSNLEYVNADWLDFRAAEPYDVVFCSMTPALSSAEGRLKALGLAREWLVFIGNSGLMCSEATAGLYERFGVSPKAFDSGPEMRAWLDGRGLEYFYRPVKGQWVKLGSKSEMVELGLISLENYGIDPDPDEVADYLEQYRVDDDLYQDQTPYHLELIIWRNS